MPLTKDLYRTGVSKLFHPWTSYVITQQCEGRTSYVMWLFQDTLHQAQRFFVNWFFIIYKMYSRAGFGPRSVIWRMASQAGWIASRAGFGPRTVVWRPLILKN